MADSVKKEDESKKEDDLKKEDESKKEDLVGGGNPIISHESIQSVDSSAVPAPKEVFKSDDVKPVVSEEGFSLMYSEF